VASPLTRRTFMQVVMGTSATVLLASCTTAVAPQGGDAESSPAGETIELRMEMYNY
jgi:hypothetical protein